MRGDSYDQGEGTKAPNPSITSTLLPSGENVPTFGMGDGTFDNEGSLESVKISCI